MVGTTHLKLPAPDQLVDVVKNRLSPCQNEHTAFCDPTPDGTVWARLDCGDETLSKRELVAGEGEQISLFLQLTMARHAENAWYSIAEMLLVLDV